MKKVVKKTTTKKLSTQVLDGAKKYYVPRCAESHKGFKVGGFTVYGGSCLDPHVRDADIYIGLQDGMENVRQPWTSPAGLSLMFHISDGHAPKNHETFTAMVKWLQSQLIAGKKVHIGCIGGHGRTGTVLAALTRVIDPSITDAIGYVRKHYCKKAVESQKQVDYLMQQWGCDKAEARAYEPWYGGKAGTFIGNKGTNGSLFHDFASEGFDDMISAGFPSMGGASSSFEPIPSPKNIWKKTLLTKPTE